MNFYKSITCFLIFSFFSSVAYGKELKVNNTKTTYTDRQVQKMAATSEKLQKKYKSIIITQEEAIRIAKGYLQYKEYEGVYDGERKIVMEHLKSTNFELDDKIDWDHPHARLRFRALRKDGSLSSGFGRKVLIWTVWFLPIQGFEPGKYIQKSLADIDARTGEVFTKYSLNKL